MADERVITFDPTLKIQALVAESDVALVGAGIKSSANGLVLRPAVDSTTGVRVQTAAGGATSIAIDTVNHRMFVGGATAPTARLHLAAGAAAAGSAPLKFASGTALTTPEDGALEELSAMVKELQAEVAALKAERS